MRQFLVTSALVLSLMFFAQASPVFAQIQTGAGNNQIQVGAGNPNNTGNTSLINPLQGVDCTAGNGNCLSAFLLNIMNFVIYIGGLVIVLMLVFIGYKFVAAQGEPGELSKAKTMLLWTLIGALVLLGSKAIAIGMAATVQALGG